MKPSVLLLPTSYAIQAWRGLRMAMHCLWAAIFLLLAKPAPDRLRRFKQVWSLHLLAILGIRLEIEEGGGVVSGSLWVANHISWLDICALNAYCPLCFVAKSEIKNWPLLGWLVASGGTVFLCRDSRRHAREVGETIGHHLKAGQDVAFFPEGTSTDGSQLLTFRAALFQGAVDSGRPVQPVAISYRDALGRSTLTATYAGDISFGDSLRAILACRTMIVRLRLAPPLEPGQLDRRALADQARESILQRLDLPPSEPAMEQEESRNQGNSQGAAFSGLPQGLLIRD